MTEFKSPAQILAELSDEEREAFLSTMNERALQELRYNWEFWARPNQLPPEGDWTTWLVLSGRGFGKTRMGAEWVRKMAAEHPGCRIALVAETAADGRDVMVEGESGLIAIDPNLTHESFQKTNRKVSWPNGSAAYLYNATEPDQLRGPQHHFAWVDELAKFKYVQDTWDQLQFGLRLGEHPRQIVTTTPRPIAIIKKLLNDPDCITTRGRTYDNAANLAAPFLRQIEDRYGGTRLGRQELEGEVLADVPGALWTRSSIDDNRLREPPEDLERIVVAVDPAVSSEEGSDENGIVVVGCARDKDGYMRGYVLADKSIRGAPNEWAKRCVSAYREFDADRIVAEKNQGGEMVESTIRAASRDVPVTLVHASRGKVVRAEPISALYEQGRIHHCGRFDELEDQMCEFSIDYDRKDGSPDRMDALVWGLTHLFNKISGRRRRSEEPEDNGLRETAYKETNVYKGKDDTSWMI